MIDRFHHLFIAVADFDKSLAFYRDTLGWQVVADWGQDGKERGAVLSGGGIKVVIAEEHLAKGANGIQPNVHLDIHDIDARFKKIHKGAHIVVEPEETHWGTRWFVVRDPDGNMIAFEELHGRD